VKRRSGIFHVQTKGTTMAIGDKWGRNSDPRPKAPTPKPAKDPIGSRIPSNHGGVIGSIAGQIEKASKSNAARSGRAPQIKC
jgi:hypothetical protein